MNFSRRDYLKANAAALAAAVAGIDLPASAANLITETNTGRIKGKMSYMSPEQCGGKKVDRRSDVFAAAG